MTEKEIELANLETLVNYIRQGANKKQRIGLELEHLVYNDEFEVIPYETMVDCLREFSQKTGGRPYLLDGKLLGIACANYALSLEPGCQLEISIEPFSQTEEIRRVYEQFRAQADAVFAAHGYALHEGALLPFVASGECAAEELPLLPKERYRVMDAHFRKTGTNGIYMMRASASTQISIDFSSEEDALRKVRMLEKLAPFVMLLTEQRDGTFLAAHWQPHLLRSQIWRNVDAARCGYLPESLAEDYSLEAYASYVYQKDSILFSKNGVLAPTDGKAAAACYSDALLTQEDADYLLSMYFPHVRIKRYIEYRVADSMPIADALDYAVFVKTLMYQETVLAALEELFLDVNTIEQLVAAEQAVSADGWSAIVYGKPVICWLGELFDCIFTHAVLDEKELHQIRRMRPLPLVEWEYQQIIRGNEDRHAPEDAAIKDYLNQSTAKYHNRVVRTLYVPKLFTHRELRRFDALVKELYGIFDKVIAHYVSDADYRALFGFPREMEDLILQKPLYTQNIPMARIDLFLDEQTRAFKFCEFNTDGASAMNEDRELNLAFEKSLAYREFAKTHDCKSCELFDVWVSEALDIYRTCAQDVQALPHVAIVDFLEHATINEFYIFKAAFEKRGCMVTVCDMRDLHFDGVHCLDADGRVIDLVYRRAVTSDIFANLEASAEFLRAYRHGAMCVLGDFRTQIVHNKILYKILHKKETAAFLTAAEQAFVRDHIPFTMSLGELFDGVHEELKAAVFREKDRWIIKPEDSYGSQGVHAGVELATDEEWQRVVCAAKDASYVLQEFCTPYRLDNIVFSPEGWRWTDTSNLTGLFVYNGKLKGMYSRVSYEQVISTQYNEMSLPTVIVE